MSRRSLKDSGINVRRSSKDSGINGRRSSKDLNMLEVHNSALHSTRPRSARRPSEDSG